MIITHIDPFDDPELCAFVQKAAQPYIHRGMTMREWLRIQDLIYTTALKVYPTYIDKMKKIDALRTELNAKALHRYLITPFGKLYRAAQAVGE